LAVFALLKGAVGPFGRAFFGTTGMDFVLWQIRFQLISALAFI